MKILVTGSGGFIGKNLVAELINRRDVEVLHCKRDTSYDQLDKYCEEAEFVYHLAGVNRPNNESDFMKGNYEFTDTLLKLLKKHNNLCPIMMASSTQANLDNLYGSSKKAGEELLLNYSKEIGTKIFIYRLPNVFGKWSKPNYNSVVATFCHNIAYNESINIDDPKKLLRLVYIDDVVSELISLLSKSTKIQKVYYEISTDYEISLGNLADLIVSFKDNRDSYFLPEIEEDFSKKLYSTYLSFLPKDDFSYLLNMNIDERGSFTEILKTLDKGQISVNISKPGIVKGNHWHHTKNEKFLVVSGNGVIRLRDIYESNVIEYYVSGDKLEIVDIPPGYTHNIENLGNENLITIMWANELFNSEEPDTYFLEV